MELTDCLLHFFHSYLLIIKSQMISKTLSFGSYGLLIRVVLFEHKCLEITLPIEDGRCPPKLR